MTDQLTPIRALRDALAFDQGDLGNDTLSIRRFVEMLDATLAEAAAIPVPARVTQAVDDALAKAWLTIHVRRFAKEEGTLEGPDTFYNGTISAEAIIRQMRAGLDVDPTTALDAALVAQRKATGRAWSAFLDLALDQRLEDGTAVLDLVLARNPGLRERLEAALAVAVMTH